MLCSSSGRASVDSLHPQVLEACGHRVAHTPRDMRVYAVHAGRVMTEPFVLEDLGDSELDKHRLVGMPQIMEPKTGVNRRQLGSADAAVSRVPRQGAVTRRAPHVQEICMPDRLPVTVHEEQLPLIYCRSVLSDLVREERR